MSKSKIPADFSALGTTPKIDAPSQSVLKFTGLLCASTNGSSCLTFFLGASNTAVCSVITKTVHSSNYCYIRNFEDDAAGMWLALKLAHQDSSSGGRMYWLRKLIQDRMSGEDIDAHIELMGGYAEKLNALITEKYSLMANDVHSTALLISLPGDWLNCVSALMNEERVPSSRIVAALKAELLRRRARGDDSNPIVIFSAQSTAAATTSTDDSKSKPFCTFCNCTGHDLLICNNASRIIKEHKAQRQQEFQNCRGPDNSNKKPLAKKGSTSNPTWAGHTSVVELDDFSSSDNVELLFLGRIKLERE
ncbi:hypothetical protein PCANC_25513 [Puccinia coronata f. sp. avenae]|uniref:Uncharacterized protein n=1 Tax=Puccinia coronata f. sp. avenae TaxID=200324 RepID=A0A2N5U9B4_9BASI|nr:hypothetical protein PCANC_25513 [Puccinia coronata f. sp. avenae]